MNFELYNEITISFFQMKVLLLTLVCLSAVLGLELPPSCIKPVYCDSKLLHYVQVARLYQDSKTFVDLEMRDEPDSILAAFDSLLNQTNDNPSRDQIQKFVDDHFDSIGELEEWIPTDFNKNPAFLNGVRDDNLRKMGQNINDIWPTLGRKVKSVVFEHSERFSFIPVTNGFIIPGGRFKELYYWDTYWIIEGLLVSGMEDTVKGVIGNLIELVKKLGHVPNGSRWYYQERSQPPLLTAMMSLYIKATDDLEFLKKNVDVLEQELRYWLDTQLVTFNVGDATYTLLRYYAPSKGPRPESYYEDYKDSRIFETQELQQSFYTEIKSAAESGWDFSTRWFINNDGENKGNLSTINTSYLIPVDLNAIFANALDNMAHFQALLLNYRQSSHWAYLAKQWRYNIKEVFWNKEDGIWYDWDMKNNRHRKYFYPSNLAPLWMKVANKSFVNLNSKRILQWLKNSNGIDYPGGVPASLIRSGEQWDFPNAWPPLVSIVVNALEALETKESLEVAFEIAQSWVRACYKGFNATNQLFEKYDVEIPGRIGGGGEYTVQTGFGWSNGVILEFLAKYGHRMTLYDKSDDYLLVLPYDSKPQKSTELLSKENKSES